MISQYRCRRAQSEAEVWEIWLYLMVLWFVSGRGNLQNLKHAVIILCVVVYKAATNASRNRKTMWISNWTGFHCNYVLDKYLNFTCSSFITNKVIEDDSLLYDCIIADSWICRIWKRVLPTGIYIILYMHSSIFTITYFVIAQRITS